MRHLEKNIETVVARPRLLSKAEVLALLGVSYTTVFTWMREGQFPLSIQLGPPDGRSSKDHLDRPDEVYAWVTARTKRKLRPDAAQARAEMKPQPTDPWILCSRSGRAGCRGRRSRPV